MKVTNLNETSLERIKRSVQTEKSKNISKGKSPDPGTGNKIDHVSISASSREIQKLEIVIAQTPDVRQDKVQDLKSRIKSGQYNIDSRKVAGKILEEYK